MGIAALCRSQMLDRRGQWYPVSVGECPLSCIVGASGGCNRRWVACLLACMPCSKNSTLLDQTQPESSMSEL